MSEAAEELKRRLVHFLLVYFASLSCSSFTEKEDSIYCGCGTIFKMFPLYLLYISFALFLVDANNEFLVPPPAGIDVILGSPLIVKWRCDDCGAHEIKLYIWQNKGDGSWAHNSLLGM